MMKSSSMHDHYCPQFLLSLWWSLRRHRSAVNSFKSINTSIEEPCRGLPLPFPFRLANREIFHMFASTKLAVFPVFVGRGFSDQKDIFLCHIHCKKELIALPAPHTHITISQTYKFRKLKKKTHHTCKILYIPLPLWPLLPQIVLNSMPIVTIVSSSVFSPFNPPFTFLHYGHSSPGIPGWLLLTKSNRLEWCGGSSTFWSCHLFIIRMWFSLLDATDSLLPYCKEAMSLHWV